MDDIRFSHRLCTLVIALPMATIVLFHVYLTGLGVTLNQVVTFWIPILILGLLSFYGTLTSNSRFPLILILVFSFVLHMVQFVRQPPEMVWNNDAIFGLQIVEHVSETGRWDFGYGTGSALSYSFYPLFYISQSIFATISGIPPVLIVKYSMAVLNLLTLLTFYIVIRRLLDLDIKATNLITLMFSLNPMFHLFNSYFHAESYAIIFFPLVLMFLLKNESSQPSRRSIGIMGIVILATISMAHPFTSYIVAISAIPIIVLYFRSKKFASKMQLCLLTLILPSVWLMFIASTILSSHLLTLEKLLIRLVHLHIEFIPTPTAGSAYYPSEFLFALGWLRNVVLLLFGVLGLRYTLLKKKDNPIYSYFVVALLVFSTLTFLSLFGGIWGEEAYNRTRFLEFSYFPIAIFIALGIISVLQSDVFKNRLRQKPLKLLIILALLVILVPSTIVNALATFNYDPTYSSSSCDEVLVAPEQQYALGLWVRANVNSSGASVLTGSGDYVAHRYVIGYGQFEGPFYPDLFNVTLIGKPLPYLTRYTLYYVVNIHNLQLPDTLGRKLSESDLQFLEANLNKIYNNDAASLYQTFDKTSSNNG